MAADCRSLELLLDLFPEHRPLADALSACAATAEADLLGRSLCPPCTRAFVRALELEEPIHPVGIEPTTYGLEGLGAIPGIGSVAGLAGALPGGVPTSVPDLARELLRRAATDPDPLPLVEAARALLHQRSPPELREKRGKRGKGKRA